MSSSQSTRDVRKNTRDEVTESSSSHHIARPISSSSYTVDDTVESSNSENIDPFRKDTKRPLVLTLSNFQARTKDGHLDITYIPRRVVSIVNRNARESPLMRLPGEIRKCIWDYVMDGLKVELTAYENDAGLRKISFSPMQDIDNRTHHTTTTFASLPIVCRQFYAETSMLLYQRATFVLGGMHPLSLSRDQHHAMRLQKNLPTVQMPTLKQLSAICTVKALTVPGANINLKKVYFPGLKKIVAVMAPKRHLHRGRNAQMTEEWVKRKQGDDVEIHFKYLVEEMYE